MKPIYYSLKTTIYNWSSVSCSLVICFVFLFLSSCQKEEGNLPDFGSIRGMNMIATSAASGDAPVLYYGHRIFTRVQGKPFVEIQNIKNPDFELFDNNFVLLIHNGNSKMTRVSSAEIKIDGVIVASPSDFSKNVSLITKQLTGLTAESILEVKLYSTPGGFLDLWIEGTLKEITVTDINGNIYKTVKIGTQWWMAENLRTTLYNDGSAIQLVTDDTEWNNLTTPGYCWYNNDSPTYKIPYGALYNWYAVNTGNLCPAGWHVSSVVEWTTLKDYLTNNGYGYDGSGGDIAKSMAATYGWDVSSKPGAPGNDQTSNNSSGFTGLPGGLRNYDYPNFWGLGYMGYWWTSSLQPSTGQYTPAAYYYRGILNYYTSLDQSLRQGMEATGLSVRCVKD